MVLSRKEINRAYYLKKKQRMEEEKARQQPEEEEEVEEVEEVEEEEAPIPAYKKVEVETPIKEEPPTKFMLPKIGFPILMLVGQIGLAVLATVMKPKPQENKKENDYGLNVAYGTA